MHVAFINRWGRGGGVVWDIQMAQQLEELGVDVTFHIGQSLDGTFKHPVSKLPDYRSYSMPDLPDYAKAAIPGVGGMLVDVDTFLFARKVHSNIDYAKYDIIHVTGVISFYKYVDEIPTVIKLCGPPHSLFHDVINPFSSSYSRLEKYDGVVATGITTERIHDQTNCSVTNINPGVDTTIFKPGESSKNKTNILFVGRFAPAKNIPLLLRAFATVHKEHPNTTLTLVGDGPQKDKIIQVAESLGIRSALCFPGYLNQEELAQYYKGADIFTLASKHESFGMVALEAMSAGLPVIAPTVGWIPEIITHEENGFIYDTGSQEQFSSELERLISNSDLRKSIGENARNTAKEQHDWESRAEILLELYQELRD